MLAPSRSPELVRESRRLIRAGEFFDPDGGVRVLAVGELLPLAPSRRGMPPAPPLDVARTLDDVLGRAPLDFVHVHEPFAPSTSSLALRHSRALNVGTFHAPAERRHLDAGRAPLRRALLRPPRRAHGVVRRHARAAGARVPGALRRDAARAPSRRRRARPATGRCGSPSSTTRTARRCGCSCARCAGCPTTCRGRRPSSRPSARGRARCARACATGSRSSPREATRGGACSRAPTSSSPPRRPGARARRCWCARSAPARCRSPSRLPAYEEVLRDGELRPAVRARRRRDARRAARAAARRRRPARRGCASAVAAARAELAWDAVAERFEAVYEAVAARRHPPRADGTCARGWRQRKLIDVDLHMHTDHSQRLRDAGRRAARHRPRAGARRDRGDRPQRGLRRARRARQGRRVRRQGDRRRGGQDRQRRAR